MRENKFICFEGVDGSGKTTLAKLLAQELHAHYLSSPPELLLPLRPTIYEYDLPVRFHYYLLGNVITSEESERILKSESVVLDRYVDSTFAFHFQTAPRRVREKTSDLLLPDHIVYITASWEEIEHRLSQRPNRKKSEELPYLQKVAEHYQRLFFRRDNVITIDTTTETPSESIGRIQEALNR